MAVIASALQPSQVESWVKACRPSLASVSPSGCDDSAAVPVHWCGVHTNGFPTYLWGVYGVWCTTWLRIAHQQLRNRIVRKTNTVELGFIG